MEDSILNNSIVYKESWLTKSPPITQMSRSKSWKRRYFVLLNVLPRRAQMDKEASCSKVTKKGSIEMSQLNGFYLVYWENEAERHKKGSKPINAIPLEGHYHIHKYATYEGKFHNLLAFTTDERVYFFSSENEVEMTSWYNHIHEAVIWMGKKNGRKSARRDSTSSLKIVEPNEKAKESAQIYDRLDNRAKPVPIPERNNERTKIESIVHRQHQEYHMNSNNSPFSPPSKFLTRSSYGSVYGYSCDDISPPQIGPKMDIDYDANETVYQTMEGDVHEDDPPVPMYTPPKRHFSESYISISEKEVKYTNSKPTYQSFTAHRTNSIPSYLKNRPACPVPMSSIHEMKKIPLHDEKQLELESIYDDIGSVMRDRDFNDVYKFTTGRAAATLSLFDTDVKLPGDSLATVNNDGVTISYNGHEITIKKNNKPMKNIFHS